MAGLDDALSDNRAAVHELHAALAQASAVWTRRPSSGKRWSPAQVAEQATRALDEAAKVVAGSPAQSSIPQRFRRLISRGSFFRNVLKNKAFPNLEPDKALDPAMASATPATARTRLEGALVGFEKACRACAADGKQVDSIYGSVSVGDFARFQAYQTRGYSREFAAVFDFLRAAATEAVSATMSVREAEELLARTAKKQPEK